MTATLDALSFREAVAEDAPRLGAVMAEGFGTYRSFAPDGWEPPDVAEFVEAIAKRLEDPGVWCLLAEDEAGVAGYVAFLPAAEARRAVADPQLAHFWMLFVRAAWWGSGLAPELHRAACAAAAERGFTAFRLFTPADQARARRFYEREGWAVADGPFDDEDVGFAMFEYRRPLT